MQGPNWSYPPVLINRRTFPMKCISTIPSHFQRIQLYSFRLMRSWVQGPNWSYPTPSNKQRDPPMLLYKGTSQWSVLARMRIIFRGYNCTFRLLVVFWTKVILLKIRHVCKHRVKHWRPDPTRAYASNPIIHVLDWPFDTTDTNEFKIRI